MLMQLRMRLLHQAAELLRTLQSSTDDGFFCEKPLIRLPIHAVNEPSVQLQRTSTTVLYKMACWEAAEG